MNSFRPTVQQERWLVAAARSGVAADTPWLAEHSGGWRTFTLLTRGAFFVLGVVAAALAAGVIYLLHIPAPMFVAGVIAIVVTEALIVRRRLFGAGIEEALEISGLVLMLAQVLDATNTYNEATIAVWLAIAFAHAGARLLNPLFITVCAALLSFALYTAVRSDIHDYVQAGTVTGIFCFLVAAIALAFGAKRFARPSIDRMLNWLVIVMPVGGYMWITQINRYWLSLALLDSSVMSPLPLLLLMTFAAAFLWIGLQRRRHAPLLAALLCVGCLAYELRNLTGLPLELRLILWGSLALIATLSLNVVLRKPRRGITSAEIEGGAASMQLLELAGVSVMTPQAPASGSATYQGEGGGFGGGGASGKF
jgi:hypothetical protein